MNSAVDEQEQLRRIASLPGDRMLYFDMSFLSRGKWVWRVSWKDAENRPRILYLGRDSYGHVARFTARYPPTHPYRMETGRRRMQRRGAYPRY